MASEACCTPAPPAEHVEEGTVTKLGHLDVYINPGSLGAAAAIVLVSDITGYNPPLLRKLADRCAAEGFFVVVPDLFQGDPFVPADPANPMATFPAWLSNHSATDLSDMKVIIKKLKEQGIKKIGVTGCCWGAMMTVYKSATRQARVSKRGLGPSRSRQKMAL